MRPFSNHALGSSCSLVRDFMRFAGRKAYKAFFFAFLGALVEGIGIVLLIPFFSVIMGSSGGGRIQQTVDLFFSFFGTNGRFQRLSFFVFGFSILMIVRAIILTTRDMTSRELEIGFVQQLRMRITHLLASSEWDTISRLRHSRMIHLMGSDIYQVGNAMHVLQADMIAFMMLISHVIVAFILSPSLAAITFSMVVAGGLITVPILRRARIFGKFIVDANLSLIDDVNQFLGALKLAIGQNLQKDFLSEFDASLENISKRELHYIREITLRRLVATTCAAIVGALILLMGASVVRADAPILIAFLLLLSRMNAPIMQIQAGVQQFAHTLPAYEKIKELENDLSQTAPVASAYLSNEIVKIDGSIEFKKVSFFHNDLETNYDSGRLGVHKVSLVIRPGSIIGISGASGSGKTTFLDLFVGLRKPQTGEIRVGGKALQGGTLASWRDRIGYVVQDPFLFHDTIRRNLIWANRSADDTDLWNALRIACADEVISKLPHGLETIVGERGALLSGGERQRLCLARAILRKPNILILDEATSAIDMGTEQKIMRYLIEMSPRPTMIIVSHRPETLAICERQIVFSNGEIVSGI